MKKLVLLFTMTIAVFIAPAQSLKLKKGMVYDGKTPLVKMEGEASIFKGVDVLFSDMDGKPVLRLKHILFDPKNPFLGKVRWQEATFEKTGEKARFTLDKPYYGNKKIIAKLEEKVSAAVFSGDWSVAAKNDESEKVLKDSTEMAQWQHKIAERLKAQPTDRYGRDQRDPVSLKDIRFKPQTMTIPGTFTKYQKTREELVYQGQVTLGKISREQDVSSETSKKIRYIFYKKLDTPFDLKGNSSEYLIAAIAEFDGPTDLKASITTFQDQKIHSINGIDEVKVPNLLNAQQSLAEYLVLKGYL